MNKNIVKEQAKTIANVFEKLTAHKMKHSIALEIVSALYGKSNFNVLSDSMKPEAAFEEMDDFEKSHALSNEGCDYGDECVIVCAENGRKIKTPSHPEDCSYVRITDRDDNEIAYWVHDEWQEDPEVVMGAIIGALNGGIKNEMPKFAITTSSNMSLLDMNNCLISGLMKKVKNQDKINLEKIVANGGEFKMLINLSINTFANVDFLNEVIERSIVGDSIYTLSDINYEIVGAKGSEVFIEVDTKIVEM